MNPPPLFYTLAPVRRSVVEPLAVYRKRGPQLHGFLPERRLGRPLPNPFLI